MIKKNFHGICRAKTASKKAPKTTKFPMPVMYIKYVKDNSFVWGVLYDNNKIRILRDQRFVRPGHRYQFNNSEKFCDKIVTEKDIISMGWKSIEMTPCF